MLSEIAPHTKKETKDANNNAEHTDNTFILSGKLLEIIHIITFTKTQYCVDYKTLTLDRQR